METIWQSFVDLIFIQEKIGERDVLMPVAEPLTSERLQYVI